MLNVPSIYVACLSSYNNGHLHGAWIDANQEPDDILEDIHAMLEASPIEGAEEWAIHDYDNFGQLTIHESDSLARVSETAALMEHGDVAEAALALFGDLEEAKAAVEDRYLGFYDSVTDYAYEVFDDSDVPERLKMYIDWDAIARDLTLNGDICYLDSANGMHIFSN